MSITLQDVQASAYMIEEEINQEDEILNLRNILSYLQNAHDRAYPEIFIADFRHRAALVASRYDLTLPEVPND